jgi:hypothetical protein
MLCGILWQIAVWAGFPGFAEGKSFAVNCVVYGGHLHTVEVC